MPGGPRGGLVVERVRLGEGTVDYREAWELQRTRHAQVVAGEVPDTVLLLEHSPVYTAGRRTNSWERPDDGTPVVDVDRGGRITWHGPGQLVGYPIVRLRGALDVVGYVRRLEELLIAVAAGFGVRGYRVEDRTGVWTADEPLAPGWRAENKLAAIGVRVSRGVTMHGFALNCDTDLQGFSHIVPCGLPDAGATSLSARAGRRVGVLEAAAAVTALLPGADLPGAAQTGSRPRTDVVA
ncbi:lipoyl(octanoyl) transferase LipB [Kineococcus aurantiacus]|uniref:lipoyl(octanoyl) transferase LipB n=1 Tax=Kineococcus aurantiacus TaxID=37633 RepID=UPI001C53DA6F|nr:lipoyl(octanoyl) transferase LipB [Kineococcus aurantiacus]